MSSVPTKTRPIKVKMINNTSLANKDCFRSPENPVRKVDKGRGGLVIFDLKEKGLWFQQGHPEAQ